MSYINRVTVNKAQRSPGHWQIKTNIATIDDRSGRRLARLQHYKTFLGTEAQAELERYRTLWAARGKPELTSSAPAPEADETVGSYAARWLLAREKDRREIEAAETERARRNRVYLYVVPAWGHLQLSTLRRGEILSGAQWLGCQLSTRTGEKLTPTTVKHALLTLQAVVEAAAERGGASLLACDFDGVKRTLLAQTW